MTDYYLDSVGGSDTEPFDTRAKAAASLAQVIENATSDPLAAGDRVFADDSHSHEYTSTETLLLPTDANINPVHFISTTFDAEPPTAYSRGATEFTTVNGRAMSFGGTRTGGIFVGFNFHIQDKISMQAHDAFFRFEDCHFRADL